MILSSSGFCQRIQLRAGWISPGSAMYSEW